MPPLSKGSPPVTVEAGQVARIRGKIRIPAAITASSDGVLVYDSLGGEALALRFSDASDWTEFSFLRPIRESTALRISLVMTGFGSVEFDDLFVEISRPTPAPLANETPANAKR